MRTSIRIALFAGLLGLVFAGAALAGSALDPDPGSEQEVGHPTNSEEEAVDSHEKGSTPGEGSAHSAHGAGAAQAKGLAQADAGLRLEVDAPQDLQNQGKNQGTLRYRILDEDGATVRDFDVEHDRRMHLIVVRRDLSGFQHLHPEQAADGSWEVPLRLAAAGTYRIFADFKSGGEAHTLGTDLHVNGPFSAEQLPHPASTAQTDAGFEVRLDEADGEVRFTVFRDGRQVRDVEPYLGARGHLVALREGDLAFLHVHPESQASEGSDIRFAVEYPSAGRYRLFLQLKVDGRVHTAAFTREEGIGHGH